MKGENSDAKRRRGITLLPNLLTTAGLSLGFYAIVSAKNGRFSWAAGAIFGAMVLDGLDGRVARMANAQTDFGAEYDSLSDMVAFGLAPALVVFEWALYGLGKLGWIAAFVYTAGTALRLARFNTQLGTADRRFFKGLPSPSAAAIVAGLVWVANDCGVPGEDLRWFAFAVTMLAGLLMVSNVPYHSFKDVDLRGKVRFVVAVGVMLVFAVVYIDPPLVLFSMAVIYALAGPLFTLLYLRRRRSARALAAERDGTARDKD
jgi:CDP-diacylglycerol--serine O-phosphatidyltransferase